jgi:hypothetical protein
MEQPPSWQIAFVIIAGIAIMCLIISGVIVTALMR